jgi:hypothetical protein
MQRPEATRYRYRSSSRRRRRRLPGTGGLDLVVEGDVVTQDVQQEGGETGTQRGADRTHVALLRVAHIAERGARDYDTDSRHYL